MSIRPEPSHDSDEAAWPAPVVERFAPLARMAAEAACRRRLTSGPQRGEVADLIRAALTETGAEVLSLDVFDTLLLRDLVPEGPRFHALSDAVLRRLRAAGHRGAEALSAEDLMVARADGMRLAYRLRPAVEGCREGVLASVVSTQIAMLGLPGEAAADMIAAELAFETQCLALNEALGDVVATHTAAGGTVIAVSDMYLTGVQIGVLLQQISPRVGALIDTIYSSADHVVSKRSGRIYPRIAAERSVPPGRFLHVGDSLHADVLQAERAGWAAVHFPVSTAELAAREAALDAFVIRMADAGLDVRSWAKL